MFGADRNSDQHVEHALPLWHRFQIGLIINGYFVAPLRFWKDVEATRRPFLMAIFYETFFTSFHHQLTHLVISSNIPLSFFSLILRIMVLVCCWSERLWHRSRWKFHSKWFHWALLKAFLLTFKRNFLASLAEASACYLDSHDDASQAIIRIYVFQKLLLNVYPAADLK